MSEQSEQTQQETQQQTIDTPIEQKKKTVEISDEDYSKFKANQEKMAKLRARRAELRAQKKAGMPIEQKPKKEKQKAVEVPKSTITTRTAMSLDEKDAYIRQFLDNNDTSSWSIKNIYARAKEDNKVGKSMITRNDIKRNVLEYRRNNLINKQTIPNSFNKHVSKVVEQHIGNLRNSFKDDFKSIIDEFRNNFSGTVEKPNDIPSASKEPLPPIPEEQKNASSAGAVDAQQVTRQRLPVRSITRSLEHRVRNVIQRPELSNTAQFSRIGGIRSTIGGSRIGGGRIGG